MRIILATALLASATVLGAVRTSVNLEWIYPADEVPNVTFNVYFATNSATPIASWTLLTNVLGTNVAVPVNPGNGFWFVTASNEFGESLPSNTAQATFPRIISGLKAK